MVSNGTEYHPSASKLQTIDDHHAHVALALAQCYKYTRYRQPNSVHKKAPGALKR